MPDTNALGNMDRERDRSARDRSSHSTKGEAALRSDSQPVMGRKGRKGRKGGKSEKGSVMQMLVRSELSAEGTIKAEASGCSGWL